MNAASFELRHQFKTLTAFNSKKATNEWSRRKKVAESKRKLMNSIQFQLQLINQFSENCVVGWKTELINGWNGLNEINQQSNQFLSRNELNSICISFPLTTRFEMRFNLCLFELRELKLDLFWLLRGFDGGLID